MGSEPTAKIPKKSKKEKKSAEPEDAYVRGTDVFMDTLYKTAR